MTPDQEKSLRKHLLDLLAGGQAHAKFDDVVKGLPAKLRGAKPAKFPHTPWMLLEHLRIAQWDILEFSRNAEHVSPNWPRGYWPKAEAPPTAAAWSRGLTRSRTDNLVVMRGGTLPSPAGGRDERSSLPGSASEASRGGEASSRGGTNVTSLSSHGRVADTIEGAVALKQEASHDLSPTEKLEALQWSKAGAAREQAPSKAERRAEAKAKGYEGEMCSECGNFTLVRNGTCMKCDTCGSTTGCS